MVIGFLLFFGESIICFRVLALLPKLPVKILHGVLHTLNFCLSVAGLAAIFEFYRRISSRGMYSLHSWIGIFAVALYTFQWLASLFVFFIPAVPDSFRSTFKLIHVPLGIILFFASACTCLMGITRVNFMDLAAHRSFMHVARTLACDKRALYQSPGSRPPPAVLALAYRRSKIVRFCVLVLIFSQKVQADIIAFLRLVSVMQNEGRDEAHVYDDQHAEDIGMKCR
nr:unnamed protein product [Spirometra erinaceieuropaei]